MEAHDGAVQKISAHLKQLYSRREPYRIFHGSTNSTRKYTVDPSRMIDTSTLSHVISVDRDSMTVLVEPNVPMDKLVEATLLYGLIPPVVMEFPGITVGGGFSGTGGESSSFKYGSFDAIINWVEFVLPNGNIVTASKEDKPDLFFGASGSLGTLGVATLFEIRLIEARKYVKVTYEPFDSVGAALQAVQSATMDEQNDYVDGILMSKTKGIVVSGVLTDTIELGLNVQRFQGAHNPWFYIHADRTTSQPNEAVQELVPLEDYLFRYDRGAFWMGKYAFQYFLTPFNRITRWVLDDFMKTRTMYHALHASGQTEKYIVQDLVLPPETAETFISQIDATFGFYPLWLCPMQALDRKSLHPHAIPGGETSHPEKRANRLLINVGVWGPGANDYQSWIKLNRKLEHILRQCGGRKWLYAPGFYTESEFWTIYDKKWFDDLRQKYNASHLPDAHAKACTSLNKQDAAANMSFQQRLRDMVWSLWPVSGLYGVLQTLTSKDYLLSKQT